MVVSVSCRFYPGRDLHFGGEEERKLIEMIKEWLDFLNELGQHKKNVEEISRENAVYFI